MPALTPAYGRNYTSAAAAKRDWLAGKDFILQDVTSQWDGKPTNKDDWQGQAVVIRYGKDLRKVMSIRPT